MNISIETTSFNFNSIKLFHKILIKLNELKTVKFSIINTVNKKIKKKKFTVLKSPHVNKNAREQFETSCYIKIIKIYSYNPLLLLFIIKRIKSELNSDVSLKLYLKSNFSNLHKYLKSNLNTNNKLKKNYILNKIFIKNYLKNLDIFGECILKNR